VEVLHRGIRVAPARVPGSPTDYGRHTTASLVDDGPDGFLEFVEGERQYEEQVDEFLEVIATQADRLTRLVDDLLVLAGLEAGGIVVTPEPVLLVPFLETVIRDEPGGDRVRLSVSAEAPATIETDPLRLHQIVTNLCTNAWHAIGIGTNGFIQVALQAVEVTPEQAQLQAEMCPGRYVCLKVTDNGCGMDPATRARAFEPFFTTKPPGVGSGLGLSVVHGIMRSYDGAIVVESEPGKGSTFRLYFPALESPTSTTTASPPDVPRGQGQRVLFVDDEPMLVRLGQTLLERLGYLALPFTNPNQALEVFGQKGAEAVLVDLSMPECNGMDFVRRALAIGPKVPVVLMTGFSADLTLEEVRAHGFSGLLPKPYDQESLGRILGKVLSQSAA